MPANITQTADAGKVSLAADGTTSADNCSIDTFMDQAAVAPSSGHHDGDLRPRTSTATRPAGFTITVTDNEAPVIGGSPVT